MLSKKNVIDYKESENEETKPWQNGLWSFGAVKKVVSLAT